ncbi:MAG: putative glycoside hydrolase [Elusimicrobia bacterium]|nr:putative glycoside hydrolase [Elusimicrobiota bacterium]
MLSALALCLALLTTSAARADENAPASTATLRGVHYTGWSAGSTKGRLKFRDEMRAAGFNAVVIALKDYDGHEFVKDVPLASRTKSFMNAIPDLPRAVKDFKDAGIYTIARIAVFKDDHLARARPDLAVHFPDGRVWANDKGTAWVDPYKKEVWEYAIDIASRAAVAGFDEIQFDYIRFPSDGKTRLCRYSRADHTPATAGEALRGFLTLARERLKPLGVKLSIDTFGLTASVDNGMGIGQRLDQMADLVDFVSPMMYPSHYAHGEYGLKNPNRQPYLTIRQGVADALGRLGGKPGQLRPYFQDFSLGVKYTPAFVRAQIRAAEEQGVRGWILWNPQNRYTWSAAAAGPMQKPEVEVKTSTIPTAKAARRRRAPAAPTEPPPDAPAPLPATPAAEAKPAEPAADAFAPSPEAPPSPAAPSTPTQEVR